MAGSPLLSLVSCLLILLQPPDFTHGFQPLFSSSANTTTHRAITERAMLLKTAEVCRDVATAEGGNFTLPVSGGKTERTKRKTCFKHSIGASWRQKSCTLKFIVRFQSSYSLFLFLSQITDNMSAAQVLSACLSSSPLSSSTTATPISNVIFQTSINTVYFSNAAVDVMNALSGPHHFDDEAFQMGRDLITTGRQPALHLVGDKLVLVTYH